MGASLLLLAVDGVTAEEGIELFQLNPLLLQLFILGAEVAGRGFSLGLGFSALEDDLLSHSWIACRFYGSGSRLPDIGSPLGKTVGFGAAVVGWLPAKGLLGRTQAHKTLENKYIHPDIGLGLIGPIGGKLPV